MTKRMRFIKKKTPIASQTSQPQEMKAGILSDWYRDIHNLPLHKFEDCFLNNNISALTIAGFPTEQELKKAWDHILIQYADLLGSDEFKLYMHLYREVEVISIDWESVKFLTSLLRNIRDQYFCDELNKLVNVNFDYPWENQEVYQKQIDRCERRGKAFKIRCDLKMVEFENMKKKIEAKNNKEIDKNYFTSMLIMLSRHYQYRITKDVTMGEYIEMIRQYKMYYDKMKPYGKSE